MNSVLPSIPDNSSPNSIFPIDPVSKQYKRHTGRSRYPVAFETSYLLAGSWIPGQAPLLPGMTGFIVFFGQINRCSFSPRCSPVGRRCAQYFPLGLPRYQLELPLGINRGYVFLIGFEQGVPFTELSSIWSRICGIKCGIFFHGESYTFSSITIGIEYQVKAFYLLRPAVSNFLPCVRRPPGPLPG